jgi:uncharacterized protein YcgI (DUF1989 family)
MAPVALRGRGGELTQLLIEPGTAQRVDLSAGETTVISTVHGGQGGDLSFPGFDQALTRNINGWERFGKPWLVFAADPGMHLYDGEGDPVFEVGECMGDGRNDIMYPGCWSELYEDGRLGCRDLISAALEIERREITGMLSFFVNSRADDDAYRGLGEVSLRPDDHVTFHALRDTALAVSACPDTAIPGWRADQLRLEIKHVRNQHQNPERGTQ